MRWFLFKKHLIAPLGTKFVMVDCRGIFLFEQDFSEKSEVLLTLPIF
jgi:hypothetical protein